MALDPNAKNVSIGFPGGNLTGSIALMKAIFGEKLVDNVQYSEANVSVKAHTRVRVIGGAATQVGATNYVRKKFPKGQRGGALAGEVVQFLVSGDWWSVRLVGSHQDLNSWLETRPGMGAEPIIWRGTTNEPYGPFLQNELVA